MDEKINLNQLWSDEMNGKVPGGTYRKEWRKQYPSTEMDEKITRNSLICYTEKLQCEKRIKELETALDITTGALEGSQGVINELKSELAKIKSDPSIGKLEVQDWPETPDY